MARIVILAAVVAAALAASSLGEFAKGVSEFTLPNGLHVIVLERHSAPVVSFHVVAHAGWANDPPGQRGISRLLERSVREGGFSAGSANPQAERQAYAAFEAAFDAYLAETAKGGQADLFRTQRLRSEANAAAEHAESLSPPDSLSAAITRFGGARFESMLLADSFSIGATLPARESETWFSLISGWIREPSFRRFYRHRTELAGKDAPAGLAKARQGLLAAAFGNTGYGLSESIPKEVAALRVSDARKWHERVMVARNLTLVVVGDVQLATIRKLAEQHLGAIAPGQRLAGSENAPDPPGQSAPEPSSAGDDLQTVAVGYRRPGIHHADDPVLDLIHQLVIGGPLAEGLRSGRRLIAPPASLEIRPAMPGNEKESLFGLVAAFDRGWKIEEVEKRIEETFAEAAGQLQQPDVLETAKNRFYWIALRQLDDNGAAATLLALNHNAYGSWKKLDEVLTGIRDLQPEQVRAVAAKYFVNENQVVWRSDGKRSGVRTRNAAPPAKQESVKP